jgi:hypothetical protein
MDGFLVLFLKEATHHAEQVGKQTNRFQKEALDKLIQQIVKKKDLKKKERFRPLFL